MDRGCPAERERIYRGVDFFIELFVAGGMADMENVACLGVLFDGRDDAFI